MTVSSKNASPIETWTSSKARTDLGTALTKALKGGDIGIELNGAVVAILTDRAPAPGRTPAIPLSSAEEARKNWAKILEAVSVRGAKFSFSNKGAKGGQVYLLRAPGYRNPYVQKWSEWSAKWKAEHNQSSDREDFEVLMDKAVEQLKHGLVDLKEFMRIGFQMLNREGDIKRTPENGRVPTSGADSLDRYEAD